MAKTPTLGKIKKTYGEKQVEAYIKVWLIGLNESLNLKRPLKEHQIDECAFLIIDEHANLTIADINIIFKKAKTGGYGELYETLSIDKILKWFSDYFNERCNVASAISRREADRVKYIESKSKSVNQMKEEEFRKFQANYLSKNGRNDRENIQDS